MMNLTEQVAAHGRLAGRPARLHRYPACRRVRSGRAGGSAGVAPARLSRRRHDRARSSAGACRDRRSRRSRCRGGDAGVGRAEFAPPALCRDRQSCRRPHRGDADGPFPVGAQGRGRRHRRIAVAARSCRTPVRIPSDPVGEYPDLVALPALEGRDDSERTRVLAADLLERNPDLLGIYSAGAGNRGIAAALEDAGRSRDIVWIAHELTRTPAGSCCAARSMPSSARMPATKRGRQRASCWRIAWPSRSCRIRSASASTFFCGTICRKPVLCGGGTGGPGRTRTRNRRQLAISPNLALPGSRKSAVGVQRAFATGRCWRKAVVGMCDLDFGFHWLNLAQTSP